MNVRDQGLSMLAIRLMCMSTPERRKWADNYMDKWVTQVRMTDLALETVLNLPVKKLRLGSNEK